MPSTSQWHEIFVFVLFVFWFHFLMQEILLVRAVFDVSQGLGNPKFPLLHIDRDLRQTPL